MDFFTRIDYSVGSGNSKKRFFLFCHQCDPDIWYQCDDLTGFKNCSSRDPKTEFQQMIEAMKAIPVLQFVGSESMYTDVEALSPSVDSNALTKVRKLIKEFIKNPEKAYFHTPCLSNSSILGIARHSVAVMLGNEATEEEITQATKERYAKNNASAIAILAEIIAKNNAEIKVIKAVEKKMKKEAVDRILADNSNFMIEALNKARKEIAAQIGFKALGKKRTKQSVDQIISAMDEASSKSQKEFAAQKEIADQRMKALEKKKKMTKQAVDQIISANADLVAEALSKARKEIAAQIGMKTAIVLAVSR